MVGAAMVMVRGKSVALRSLEFHFTITWNTFGQVTCSVKLPKALLYYWFYCPRVPREPLPGVRRPMFGKLWQNPKAECTTSTRFSQRMLKVAFP